MPDCVHVCVSICCATCCSVPTAGPNTGTRKTDTEWSEIHRNYTKYDEDEKSADALKRAEADWAEEYAKGVAADAKVKRRYTVGVLVGSVTPFWGTLQAIMTADSDAYAADKVLQVRHDDLIISLHCSPVSEGGPLLWIESLRTRSSCEMLPFRSFVAFRGCLTLLACVCRSSASSCRLAAGLLA